MLVYFWIISAIAYVSYKADERNYGEGFDPLGFIWGLFVFVPALIFIYYSFIK